MNVQPTTSPFCAVRGWHLASEPDPSSSPRRVWSRDLLSSMLVADGNGILTLSPCGVNIKLQGLKMTLEKMDNELPRNSERYFNHLLHILVHPCVLHTVTELLCDVFISSSISNRVALARAVHIERLMKTNKVRTEHLSHTQYSSALNLYGSEEGQGSFHM